MKVTRREKKKDHALTRATASVQRLGISEETRHAASKKQMGFLTHADGVRPTPSPDPAPGVT